MSPTTWRSLGQTRPMPYLMMTWLLTSSGVALYNYLHDNVIIWKHFPRNRPFVQGIHRSPVNSPHKGQWRGALMFSLICAWINAWVSNHEAGDLKRHRVHYGVIVMIKHKRLNSGHVRISFDLIHVIGPRPFVQGIHRSPVNFPHKGQWRGALMFSFTCAWAYSWVNNEDAGYLRRHCSHYDAIVMYTFLSFMGLLLMTYIFSLLEIVNTVHLTNILGGYLFSIYCVLLWCGTGRFLPYPSRSILNLHWRRCPQDVIHF